MLKNYRFLTFPLLNKKELAANLNNVAKPDKVEDFQKDIYFTPAHQNFLDRIPICKWLRLRESKKELSINYKNWHKDKNLKAVSCDKYESKINDINTMKNIFKAH